MPKRLTPIRDQSCPDCKKDFPVYDERQKRCPDCQVVHRNTRSKYYTCACEGCGTGFKARNGKAKLCSKCSLTATCRYCRIVFNKSSPQNRSYCSEDCSNKHKNEKYFGGNYFTIMDRDEWKCRKCGTTEGLHLHHIDWTGRFKKDDSGECNNSPDNLMALCNSCHQKLHTTITFKLAQKHINDILLMTDEFLRS